MIRVYSNPDQDPLTITEIDVLRCPASLYTPLSFESESYGKWLFFRNFEDINATWEVIKAEIRSGSLGATGAMCNTLRYNPLNSGAGPSTTGRIMVFTKKENMMEVGMRLIRLPVVEHDIRYKTQEDTEARRLHFLEYEKPVTKLTEPVTIVTLYWNNGEPSTKSIVKQRKHICRNDKRLYDHESDIWKINVVYGSPQNRAEPDGKWIVPSNYDQKSEYNITNLWHVLKPRLEKGEIPAIKMVCPASKQKGEQPEIHVFTSNKNVDIVGNHIIYLLEKDITYIVGEQKSKTLYWNRGKPAYNNGINYVCTYLAS